MIIDAGLDVVGAWADLAATSEGILRNTAQVIFFLFSVPFLNKCTEVIFTCKKENAVTG